MGRDYQFGFSANNQIAFDVQGRERKARTMVAVLKDYLDRPLNELNLLDVGGSTGIIDHYLAGHFRQVIGTDIDDEAIRHAHGTYRKENLVFQVADALHLPFSDGRFDVVVCAHVYEHVPDARIMMQEIFRVLKPGGVCYFAADNRFRYMEPHHHLPFLSAVPRPLAHWYLRLAGKGKRYHELHFSYWGLKSLVRSFQRVDYTRKLIKDPGTYGTEYMVRPGSIKAGLGRFLLSFLYCLSPGYIWLLRKVPLDSE